MTPKVKELYEQIIKDEEVVDKIMHDPRYGRNSVIEDFDTTAYFAEKAIKYVKEGYTPTDPSEQGTSNPREPDEVLTPKQWKVPDEWKYEDDYIYNADDEKYVFLTREVGTIVPPKTWVKNLIEAYSDWDGDPATINEICRRFGITRGVFNEIKRAFGLTHDHEPFTPEEVVSRNERELAMEAYQKKRFKTKVEFDKIDWKATQKEAKKWRELKQSLLNELNSEIPKIEVDPIVVNGGKGGTRPDRIIVETTDWHLGAEAKGLESVRDFNSEVLKNYLDKIIWLVRNEYPEAAVHVHFMGDIMETVTGMNHPDSWKNIEKGYYGAKVILESIELLSYLVEGLRASKFVAVTGNHGRLTSDKKRDHDGEAELIVYETLNNRLKDVEVIYGTYKAFDVVDGIGHVLFHGHNRVTKDEDMTRLLRNFDKIPDFLMVKQGHTHCFEVKEETNYYRHYVVGALFTGHKYNERNGYGNPPSFNVVYRHPFTNQVKMENYIL
jgi:hypothetical protein